MAEHKCPSCGCALYKCPYPDFQGVPWYWCDLEDTYYHGSELIQADTRIDDEYENAISDEDWLDSLHTADTVRWGL